MFAVDPYRTRQRDFNVRGLDLPSAQSGVNRPQAGAFRRTPISTEYNIFDTERYMLMPQNNPDGYARTAPKNAAANLHGQLLLLHGAMDDNVHMANTMQFVYELEKANKPFELLLYPKSRHGVSDPALVRQMRERMLEFTLRTLKPESDKGTK